MNKTVIFVLSLFAFWQLTLFSMMNEEVAQTGEKAQNPPKKISMSRLSGFDALRNYKPTSPRLYSPREEEKDCCLLSEGCNCFLYYCLCLPLCYACCQKSEDSYSNV